MIVNVFVCIDKVKRNINLVYGGGNIGLMGQLAQTVQDAGGHVVGVIPRALVGPDLAGHTVGESIVVTDMHTRKAEMARRSDAFIALPGGYGTLEELLEVITWSQLKIHEKPVRHSSIGPTFGFVAVREEYNSVRFVILSQGICDMIITVT